MKVDQSIVQEIAPDQASVNAAKKLLKPAKWPVLGMAEENNTIWGQCQGSGSTPYYTMADVIDKGYKCTCPSRKFPCKHVLALYWQFADAPQNFTQALPPEWVDDWLGRRRRSDSSKSSKPKKANISLTEAEAPAEPELSAEALAKQAAQKQKRDEQNKQKLILAVTQGIEELSRWIQDQLAKGMIQFIKEIHQQCRQIAARLVDAKAAILASRLDEFPAKVMAAAVQEQPEICYRELAKLSLLTRLWLTQGEQPEIYQAIVATPDRETVFEQSQLSVIGNCLVIGDRAEMRKNGLLARMRWLIPIANPEDKTEDKPADQLELKPALLLDYYPKASSSSTLINCTGQVLQGELSFYSARHPYRAIFNQSQQVENVNGRFPVNEQSVRQQYLEQYQAMPWQEQFPIIASNGHVIADKNKGYWWCGQNDTAPVPLSNSDIPTLVCGSQIRGAFLLYNGQSAELVSVDCDIWGIIACQ